MFGVRFGGALRVSTHVALRFDAQGAKTFSGTKRCTNVANDGTALCAPGMGTLSGATLGFGYIDTDASGTPRNFVSIAPGVFRVAGDWSDTGATGFGFRATLEHRLQGARSGALVVGVGIRAVLNVHHDSIMEIPLELGGWSW